MSSERRCHPRYSKQLPVMAELPDGYQLDGTTSNLSCHGARLTLNHRLPSGVYLMVELNPPSNQPAEIFTLWANVLYSTPTTENHYELGIQYAHPPQHYLHLIDKLKANKPS